MFYLVLDIVSGGVIMSQNGAAKVKILLYGSTQIQHIKKLFESHGIDVVMLSKEGSKKSLLEKIYTFIKQVKGVDIVYQVYGCASLKIFLTSKLLKKRTIKHWIGTDVLEERKKYNSIVSKINRKITDINLSGSSLLKEELREVGINSHEVPIIPSTMFSDISLMPDKHAVLVYAPEGRELFYGMDYVKELAKLYPEIEFHVVANSNDNLFMDNVIFHGILSLPEMTNIYNKISILFRFPEHDGLSMMLLEALAKGKHVIYPYPFPYVHMPASRHFSDIQACFENIISNPPEINYRGSNYIHDTYTDAKIFNLYKDILAI
jgi:hypothetical protein